MFSAIHKEHLYEVFCDEGNDVDLDPTSSVIDSTGNTSCPADTDTTQVLQVQHHLRR